MRRRHAKRPVKRISTKTQGRPPFALPASVRAVTFADAQHGYLVGDHAMAYRYRIVPIEYTAPGMIGAMATMTR